MNRLLLVVGLLVVAPGRNVAMAQGQGAQLVRSIDSVFAPWSRTDTPGCAVGVDQGGKPLIRRAYGMANLETGTPWTVNTISESGSVAKQFVAAALVLLARDGALSLDEDIIKWVPEVKGFGKRITIRHLLSHTSGIPDRYTLHEAQGRPAGVVDHDNAEVMRIVAQLRELNFDPGEDYLYSNTGYVIATTIVSRVSGKSLQAFSDERIFKPLGMADTRWREDHRVVVPGRASAYTGTLQGGFRNDHPFTRVYGSGGLLVTVNDFLRWQAALQKGEGPWGAVRDSLERVNTLNEGTRITYALGVSNGPWRGVRSISHTGSTGGYRAALYRFPEQDVAVALLCNVGAVNPGAVAQRVAATVLGATLAAAPTDPPGVTLEPAVLNSVLGAYFSPRTEESFVLALRNGRLVDSTVGQNLIPLSPTRFQYQGSPGTLTVLPGKPGEPAIRYETPNSRPVDYVAVPRTLPDAATRAAYVGEYRSPELGAIWRVTLSGDTLRFGQDQGTVMRPLFKDGFLIGNETLRFERDKRGRVTGLVIYAGRVRHLRFVKEEAR